MQRTRYKKVAYQRTIHKVKNATWKYAQLLKLQAEDASYMDAFNTITEKERKLNGNS